MATLNRTGAKRRIRGAREGGEMEINDFEEWLVGMKGIERKMAYYYAISVKSLLLGLPYGAEMAHLFNIVLDGICS